MLHVAKKFQLSLFCNFRRFHNTSESFERLINSGVLSINEEVKYALAEQHPVVALESTIITHGLPYPDNVKCAMDVENEIRQKGAVPATIAILNGVIRAGLSIEEMETLGNIAKSNPIKTSRRDFPYVISNKSNGGTTVSGTLIVANKIGIPIFATGGIGGVHREGETTFDISADLIELGKSQVAVVSSGVKSILDIPKTLEYLETQGVFVATYGATKDFPAFYSRKSGCQAPYSIPNATEAARIISSTRNMNLQSGMLFAVPVPEEYALNDEEIQKVIERALEEARKNDIRGKQITPFLLRNIWEMTHGKSLHTNIALIKNNAKVAASIAVEIGKLEKTSKSSSGTGSRIDRQKDDIVVIGGSNLDLCARIDEGKIKLDGRMHPSKFSYVAGGVARNISEALSKMGSSPTFITAIGDDETGRLLSSMMTEDLMKRAKIIKGKNTAQCIIVLDPQGDCSCLFADFEIHKQITPEMIIKNEEKISTAKLIVLDGNLTIKSIQQVLELATNYNIAVFFEPTDVIVSAKPFETNYWKAVKFITPNVQELLYIATKLNIVSPSIKNKFEGIEEISEVAKSLANYIDNVIVTLGSNGILIARRADASQPFLLASNEKDVRIRHYPAEIIENIVNVSGAGDCFASGLIMSMLEGKPEDICISVGLSAARQSLQSSFTVAKNMFDQNHSCWKSHARYIEI